MNKFILGVLLLLGVCVFFWTCKSSLEPFEDMTMTPWFGYEPGYGPGWGRRGCCSGATKESITAKNP
jgi:hypothetical protein